MIVPSLVIVLRHNIALGGDVALAERELRTLAGVAGAPLATRADLVKALGADWLGHRFELRRLAPVAFEFRNLEWARVVRLLARSGFAQEGIVTGLSLTDTHIAAGDCRLPNTVAADLASFALVILAQGYVLESEGVLTSSSTQRLETTVDLLLEPFRQTEQTIASRSLRRAKKTTLSLSHDLHVYKAKFFPRLVRALLNVFAKENAIVLDPFAGSGTALLEGALLGHQCTGVDLDPICELISRSKVAPFTRGREIVKALDNFENHLSKANGALVQCFPQELSNKLRRRDRIDGTSYHDEVVPQASKVAAAVQRVSGRGYAADLVRVLASDAVTKKVRYRFIGVGNGKYTIEIVRQQILDRLRDKVGRSRQLAAVFKDIPRVLGTALGTATASGGDARDASTWGLDEAVDVILTSPPYLPASSGREHYAASRALAFFVLGMEAGAHGYYDTQESEEARSTGWSPPPEAQRLLEYLASDESAEADPQRDAMRFLRKAIPTRQYLADMQDFFAGAKSKLKRDGVLLLVVASQHVFYSHRRGEIEHVVSCRDLYSEIGARAGFVLDEEIRMELMKSATSRARPRAKDDYFESVLVFRHARSESRRSAKST